MPFTINRQHAKLLRVCWTCKKSTANQRKGVVYCSDACKQQAYRIRQKVDAQLAELPGSAKSVTVLPAIGGKNVTKKWDTRPSGTTSATAEADSSDTNSKGGDA